MLVARALQKRRVGQHVCRRLGLTEKLLRREQIASFRKGYRGMVASIAPKSRPGKGIYFPQPVANWVPIDEEDTATVALCDGRHLLELVWSWSSWAWSRASRCLGYNAWRLAARAALNRIRASARG
jgi:hypothetical protein